MPCWLSSEGSKENCTPSCGLSQQYCGGNASSGGVSLRLKAMQMKFKALRQVIILRVWLTASWLDQKIWPWSELITEVILAIRQDGWGGHHGGQWKRRGGLVMRTSCTMEIISSSTWSSLSEGWHPLSGQPLVRWRQQENRLDGGVSKCGALPGEKLYGSDRLDKDDKIVMISITYSLEFSGWWFRPQTKPGRAD